MSAQMRIDFEVRHDRRHWTQPCAFLPFSNHCFAMLLSALYVPHIEVRQFLVGLNFTADTTPEIPLAGPHLHTTFFPLTRRYIPTPRGDAHQIHEFMDGKTLPYDAFTEGLLETHHQKGVYISSRGITGSQPPDVFFFCWFQANARNTRLTGSRKISLSPMEGASFHFREPLDNAFPRSMGCSDDG